MFCCSWVATCKFENHIDDWIQASTSYSFQFWISKAVGVAPYCTIWSNRRLCLNGLPFTHCLFNISIARSYYMNFITLNASTYRLNVHRLYTMHVTHTRFKWGLSFDNFFLQAGEWVAKWMLSKLNQVGEWLKSKEGKHKKIYGWKGRRWRQGCL